MKLKAIEKFKASKDFETKVTKDSLVAYKYGFEACKAWIA